VREALQLLVAEGLIVRRRKSGTSVVGQIVEIPADEMLIPADVTDDGRFRVTKLGEQTVDGDPFMSRRLGLAGERITISEWLITVDGKPASLRTSFMPEGQASSRIVDRILDLASTFEYVFETPLGGFQSTIEAVALEPRMAGLLGLPIGSPALMRELVLRDEEGRAREIGYTLYRGDMFAVTTTSGVAAAI
jgi:GntR family transcriptional regulator